MVPVEWSLARAENKKLKYNFYTKIEIKQINSILWFTDEMTWVVVEQGLYKYQKGVEIATRPTGLRFIHILVSIHATNPKAEETCHKLNKMFDNLPQTNSWSIHLVSPPGQTQLRILETAHKINENAVFTICKIYKYYFIISYNKDTLALVFFTLLLLFLIRLS